MNIAKFLFRASTLARLVLLFALVFHSTGFVYAGDSTNDHTVSISMRYEPGPRPNHDNAENPWIPTGVGERIPEPECQASLLERQLLEDKSLSRPVILNNFFARCEAKLARFGQHNLLSLQKLDRAKYEFLKNPLIREIVFDLREGDISSSAEHREIVRGILALKPGTSPRPLLLIICGLFCSVSDSTLFRNLLMHGGDESPFHVMVLNSNTSPEFYLDNRRGPAAGFSEGRTAILIADWLRRHSELRDKFSSLHLMGVSNGGQAALFAAGFNRPNHLWGEASPLNSVTALCPVVNAKPSLEYVFEQSQVRQLFYKRFWSLIEEVHPDVPALQRLVDLNRPVPARGIGPLYAAVALDYYHGHELNWALPPFHNFTLDSADDYWELNRFAKYPSSTIATPTLIWAPRNDGIVRYAENVGTLEETYRENPYVNILATPHGNHCGFSLAYGWDTTSAILRTHILSHSPEFLGRRRVEEIQISRADYPQLGDDEKHIGQEWIAHVGQENLELNFRIFDPKASPNPVIRCEGDPFAAPFVCYRRSTIAIPLANLSSLGIAVPQSEIEAQVLTRWLNANIRMLAADGGLLSGTNALPWGIRWINYDAI